MEKFAGYGFNKSHAAAYSLLAYHTAWIKVHFAAEFFAANMTVELDDTDKLKALLVDAEQLRHHARDARRQQRHLPLRAGRRRRRCATGWARSRAPGRARSRRSSRRARAAAPFTSLFDFCARVDRGRINRRVVEALVKAGAFDALHADRSSLLASVGLALDWADTQAAHADQGGLFDFAATTTRTARAPQEPPLVAARDVEHQGAPDAREVGARLLPVGPPVRPERGRGAALRAS